MNFDFSSFIIGIISGTIITGFVMIFGFIKMEMDDKQFFKGWSEGERFGRSSERARMENEVYEKRIFSSDKT